MGKIILEDIELYAFHGCYEEEQKSGGRYLVNADMDVAFDDACQTDDLKDTFDYQKAIEIIKKEMDVKSHLLEHVAQRIINKIFDTSPMVWAVKIRISKMNPPLGTDIKSVSIEIYKEREK